MATPLRPSCVSLCSGIGGLEIAIERVFGSRVLVYVEREAFAATVLLDRMETKGLEPAPIWCGNLEDFDATVFAGVDIVTAGFPCQPFSVAGLRKGKEDERWIWPEIARILGIVRPRIVFLENVPPLVVHGLDEVLWTLADIGLDAEWGLFRASEMGAPHQRQRCFILGMADASYERWSPIRGSGRSIAAGISKLGRDGEPLGDADGSRRSASGCGYLLDARQESRSGRKGMGMADPWDGQLPVAVGGSEGRDGLGSDGAELADADSRRLGIERATEHSRDRVHDVDRRNSPAFRWPPGPNDSDGWREWLAHGGPAPSIESGIRRSADGLSDRMDRLCALGNAVVPAQAELALRELMARFE